MKEEMSSGNSRQYRKWELSYAVVIISLGIVTSISLGYGLWAAFQFSDTGAAEDLARLVTSGFLFVFCGLAAMAMWLRLINVQDNRFLVQKMTELLEEKGK